MISVVIAAYNEAAVIGRNLDLLLEKSTPGELDVIVVANGCTDDTVERASARGVLVIDRPTPGKAAALDAGDALAKGYPRVYLDADIAVTTDSVRAVAAALAGLPTNGGTKPLAAAPCRRLVLTGRPLAVRCYFAIQSRLPAARTGLYGRGMIALSDEGRARFDRFPEILADDLFLDSLFSAGERIIVTSVHTDVETPRHTTDLLRRLTRVRRGNAALRRRATTDASVGQVRSSQPFSWFFDVVLRRPWLAPAGVVFAVLTLVAEQRARRESDDWGSDTSSRTDGAARDA
ncbi:glycosyltransferase [Cellulomonas sp. McL0617]|uniref:glycosyltransferase n=1 Tax=Cellulomonas sp. McL0617 TaxID=3415675 RepID=UPI003CECCE41